MVPSLILAPLLLMPFWLFLTEPYVVKPSSLKLYEAIHPTYYVGLIALILAITILSVRAREVLRFALNPYLLTAILATFYLQLPPIALFEHPISDHTIHLVPAFYMLREGNINMPNYPHPETVAPQLFASIFIMVTLPPSPLEDLHRISLLTLPLLTTLYIYIFMRRLGAGERFAMIASVLNMGLMQVSFIFLRQTYAMPLYIMLVFLVFMAMKERQANYSVLAIVTTLAFIMSDPAHVLLTIIPLTLFAAMWKGLDLLRKVNYKSFRTSWIFILFMGVAFFSWIISRYPGLFPDLWRIAETMWDVFIRSICELTLQIRESPAYWGRPTALVYNNYYMILYRTRVMLIMLSMAFPVMLFAYALLNRKIKLVIFQYEIIYLVSFFTVTAIVLILRGYGFIYTPWTAITTLFMLERLNNIKFAFSINKAFTLSVLCLAILSTIIAPHIMNVAGQYVSTADIHLSTWLGRFVPPDFYIITPFAGYDLDEISYMISNYKFAKGWYITYENLSEKQINELTNFKTIAIGKAMIFNHFEKTEAIYYLPSFLSKLTNKLSKTHNAVYASGSYNVVYVSKNA